MATITSEEFVSRCNDNIDLILDGLGIEECRRNEFSENIMCACPIHKGDNPNGVSYSKTKMIWTCWTHGCNEDYGNDITGLVAGALYNDEEDMTMEQKRGKAFRKLLSLLDLETTHIVSPPKSPKSEKKDFIRNTLKQTNYQNMDILDINILKTLKYPHYMIERDFDNDIITTFDVGLDIDPSSYMCGRIVIPIFDHHSNLVGMTARSIFGKCENCKQFHDPIGECVKHFPKWKHSFKLMTGQLLFNVSKAREHIQKFGTIILTEGPFDVMRLWQHGVYNAVSLFGTSLSEQQLRLLWQISFTAILALDNDEAGQTATNKIINKLEGNKFTCIRADLPSGKDVGDLSSNEIRDIFKGYLNEEVAG